MEKNGQSTSSAAARFRAAVARLKDIIEGGDGFGDAPLLLMQLKVRAFSRAYALRPPPLPSPSRPSRVVFPARNLLVVLLTIAGRVAIDTPRFGTMPWTRPGVQEEPRFSPTPTPELGVPEATPPEGALSVPRL